MRKLTCLVTLLLVAVITNAQIRQVSGTVVSKSTSKPLQGVTIQSGKNFASTDANGAYTIQAKKGDSVIFSFVGMKSFSLLVGDQNDFSIAMENEQQSLGEVVVVGYTSQRKRDLTGAVAVVNVKEVKDIPLGNPVKALQGRIPGVFITSDGSPGGGATVRIRGVGTLGNNDPLCGIL